MDQLIQLRNSLQMSDVEVIGSLFQEMDRGFEFVVGDNNYVWFYAIGKFFQPKVIVEMGTRFGYSLKAFTDGAGHKPEEYTIWAYDSECDGIKCLDIFEEYFRQTLGISNLNVVRAATQDLEKLDVDGEADLCMVDGYHTVEGCFHECELAYNALRPGGVMVVDDFDDPFPPIGCQQFCKSKGISGHYLPSFRGIYLIQK